MRVLTALVVAALFGGVTSTPAQERPRVPRIGYLALGSITPPTFFARKMGELGYLDGQTATFEYRFAEGRHERLLPLARELVERADAIYAYGDEAVAAAQVATKTVPIVMFACDAVTTGFVASLARRKHHWRYVHHHRAFREAHCRVPRNGATPKTLGRALQSREQEQADGLCPDARGGEFARYQR